MGLSALMRKALAVSWLLFLAGLWFIAQQEQVSAFWQSRDSNYNIAISGGGGSASYAYKAGATANPNGVNSQTYSGLNLGSGSVYSIVGVYDGSAITTSVKVNGTSLSLIVSFTGNDIYLFAGTATVTGSDSIVVGASTNYAANELDVMAYSALNLISTTPQGSNSGAGSSISTTCTVGDFVFAMAAAGANFSGSAQAPSGTHTEGTDGAISDWTSNATGCSGGTFTATTGGFNGQLIATWH